MCQSASDIIIDESCYMLQFSNYVVTGGRHWGSTTERCDAGTLFQLSFSWKAGGLLSFSGKFKVLD